MLQIDSEWNLTPLKLGTTGKAFQGIREEERVFVKQNPSPLLVSLSSIGIAPKIIWSKRMGTGGTYCAQEWVDGEIFSAQEMAENKEVIYLLYRLHHSFMLLDVFEKIGGTVLTPANLFNQLLEEMPEELIQNYYISRVVSILEKNIPSYDPKRFSVVHGDVNHSNWMHEKNQVYLVDWDNPIISDSMIDISNILIHYIPQHSWEDWLEDYGVKLSEDVRIRLQWYATLNVLQEVNRLYQARNFNKINDELTLLKNSFHY